MGIQVAYIVFISDGVRSAISDPLISSTVYLWNWFPEIPSRAKERLDSSRPSASYIFRQWESLHVLRHLSSQSGTFSAKFDDICKGSDWLFRHLLARVGNTGTGDLCKQFLGLEPAGQPKKVQLRRIQPPQSRSRSHSPLRVLWPLPFLCFLTI
jgi:hypothetical protein